MLLKLSAQNSKPAQIISLMVLSGAAWCCFACERTFSGKTYTCFGYALILAMSAASPRCVSGIKTVLADVTEL